MAKPRRLAAGQHRALARLSRAGALEGLYLAGGSAIGLRLGHRTSEDLDFFSLEPDLDLAVVARRVRRALPDVKVVARSEVALKLDLGGTAVDIVSYPYPPLVAPERSDLGAPIAQLLDLAVMKLATVAQRGLRRDYWDLYALLSSGGLTIERVGRAFLGRFKKTETDLYHVARALTFFEDTERDPHFPKGLTRARWQTVKAFLSAQAPALLELSAEGRRRR